MNIKFFSPVLILLLFFTFSIIGCSADSVLSKGFIDGQIMVVGNEPFTKLALFDTTNRCYILECSEKIKNELWKKQGSFLRIFFDAHKQDFEGVILTVNHIEYIKQSPR